MIRNLSLACKIENINLLFALPGKGRTPEIMTQNLNYSVIYDNT